MEIEKIRELAAEVLPEVQYIIERDNLRQRAANEGWLGTLNKWEVQAAIENIDIGYSPDVNCYSMAVNSEEYGIVSMILVPAHVNNYQTLVAILAHEWTHILLYPSDEQMKALNDLPESVNEENLPYERLSDEVQLEISGMNRKDVVKHLIYPLRVS